MKLSDYIEIKNSSFRDCRFLDRARVAQMVERHSASELQLEVGGSSPPPRAKSKGAKLHPLLLGLAGATSEGQSFPGVTPSVGPRAGAQATGNHGGGWAVRFRPGLTTIRGGTLKKQHLASSLAGEREELRGAVTRKELGGGRAQSWVMFGIMEVRALPASPGADHQDRPTSQGADRGQVPRRRPVLFHAAIGRLAPLPADVAVWWPKEGALEAAAYLEGHVRKCSTLSYITSRRGSSDCRSARVRTPETGDSIALLSSILGPRGSTPRSGIATWPGHAPGDRTGSGPAIFVLSPTVAVVIVVAYEATGRSAQRLPYSFASERSPPLSGRCGCIGGKDTRACTPRVHVRVSARQRETTTRWRRKCVGPLEGAAD